MKKDLMEFGIPHKGEINRTTIVAVLFNKKTNKFFYCDWPEYGLCCLISGGVEEGESDIDAIEREIKEETGFQNFQIIDKLGGQIVTHYYMSKKDEYRAKQIHCYLVLLLDDVRNCSSLEDDEQFFVKEAKHEELLDLMRAYKGADGGGLEDHIEILNRGQEMLLELKLI